MKIINVGCVRAGARLAQTLSLKSCSVMVVDKDPTSFNQMGKSYQGRTVLGVGLDRDVLIEARIERAVDLAEMKISWWLPTQHALILKFQKLRKGQLSLIEKKIHPCSYAA